ncbi:MAG TPA: DMT family transporter [Solirubrobacteraceae bacterium]|jgi:drug/metabolite transporter (DMT)-like permease|nr:DMT family transporter [Solirubrobacteraceae bacterium]
MLAVALGLSSSLCWGLADFVGGLQSRRMQVLAVLLVSQAAGLIAIVVGLVIAQPAAPSLVDLWPAVAAGLAGAVALGAFYRALATGTMSIVAPISATGAALPVIVGIATGDRPSALQVVGILAAVIGVVLASRELDQDRPQAAAPPRTSIALALVAAVGFGTFFIGMDAAADTSVPWTMLAARGASVVAVALTVAVARTPLPRAPRRLGALAVVGLLDVGANGLFAWGSTKGLLSVVAVLGALYPVSTVLLARVVLDERVRRIQEVGIVAALAGVALIAAG